MVPVRARDWLMRSRIFLSFIPSFLTYTSLYEYRHRRTDGVSGSTQRYTNQLSRTISKLISRRGGGKRQAMRLIIRGIEMSRLLVRTLSGWLLWGSDSELQILVWSQKNINIRAKSKQTSCGEMVLLFVCSCDSAVGFLDSESSSQRRLLLRPAPRRVHFARPWTRASYLTLRL